jgi:hypothetical protein
MTDSEQSKDIGRSFVRAINEKSWGALCSLVAADFRRYSHAGDPLQSREEGRLRARRRNAMWSSPREVPLQNALAAALSLLTLFVGVVHEVVGATLYPDGPAQFGGAFFWHLAGLALVIAGAWLVLGSLGMLRAPVRLIAGLVAIVGVVVSAHDAIQLQQFHLFATTLAVSGAGVCVLYRA